MSQKKPLQVGDRVKLAGCFTEEYFLRGLSLKQIGQELGLPAHRLAEGALVAFAIQLPRFLDFELGGWAKYSTDKFVNYRKGRMEWSERRFEQTYAGKRVPITIEEAKWAWLKNMRKEKLVKILPMVDHQKEDVYPAGGLASQIIIKDEGEIECQIVQFLKPSDVFRGVWQ